MALIKVVNNINEELLKEISCKLDKLLAAGNNNDDTVIKKATADLSTSTDEVKEAIDKNTPSLKSKK